jgi:hypothetical protein
MIVTSVCVGHHVTGLKVGARNARRYFPRGASEIELQLGHLCIQCGLTADFWQDQPEIHDPRLCLWLESKQWTERASAPALVAMNRSGENSFTLGFVDNRNKKLVRRQHQKPCEGRDSLKGAPIEMQSASAGRSGKQTEHRGEL